MISRRELKPISWPGVGVVPSSCALQNVWVSVSAGSCCVSVSSQEVRKQRAKSAALLTRVWFDQGAPVDVWKARRTRDLLTHRRKSNRCKSSAKNAFLSRSHGVTQSRLEIVKVTGEWNVSLSVSKCPLGSAGYFSAAGGCALRSPVGLTPLHPH